MRTPRPTRAPLLAGNGPLSKVPAPLVFLVVLAVFITGVLVSGMVGALLLGALAAGLLVLLSATWRVLGTADRLVRLLVVGILAGIAIAQLS
ncbi:hypothetical protein EV191_102125 [Tamaricihabitans halophyticus]|uniref:Uncharacterized protein n=1 Tax=Tamaricihabitans halophyticus TaxID=1262583 RepID=A0A4V2SUK2_9PSEU|nr:DUF6703 family protein [Tamaricihabitans halophyticus]TCP54916.1 hypothetical protein EV191_102125 [Tamaricihabitans halophyticus]